MDLENTKKGDFELFFKRIEIYNTLKKISEWKYDDFRNKLKLNIETIKNILESAGQDLDESDIAYDKRFFNLDDMNSDEIIDFFLEIYFMSIKDSLFSVIETNIEELSIIDEELNNVKNGLIKKLQNEIKTNFKNPIKWFRDKERFFNGTAEKTLKKLAGLYSLASDND
jgi:uncharacterized protein YnzC (UPF0291/DUF896 family)